MVKLKNCPFCGNRAYINSSYSYKYKRYCVFAKCDTCGGQGKLFNSDDDPAIDKYENEPCQCAAKAWNRRFDENEE